jgi:hypothetical protein
VGRELVPNPRPTIFEAISADQAPVRRRRLTPIRPSTPEPSSHTEPGTGTMPDWLNATPRSAEPSAAVCSVVKSSPAACAAVV